MADREVEGVDLSELEDQYQAFEAAVLSALNLTMRKAVREDAVADTLPRLSLDDLNVIPGQWAVHVPALADDLANIYVQSADMQAAAYLRARGDVALLEGLDPDRVRLFTSEHESTLAHLAQASNRLVGIGDDLWADAREELLTGMTLGEDVGAISARVRKVTDVTAPRARMIARTECLPGSATVTAARATAIYRRWYDGEWATVRLRSGREFSGTPNHPMLTHRGWVALGELTEGDHLLYDCIQVEGSGSFRDDDRDDRPPTIGEMFDAASKAFVLEWRDGGSLDFHGDGTDGDVEVVYPDGVLLVGQFAPVTERRIDLGLECPDEAAVALDAYRAVFRGLSLIHGGAGFENVAPPDSGLVEDATDDAFRYAEFARYALSRASRLVVTDDGVNRQVSVGPRCDFPSGETNGGGFLSVACNAGGAGELQSGVGVSASEFFDVGSAETGGIEGDEVVSLSLGERWVGHVYNLTTLDGYYSVAGFYTGNCVGASNAGSIAFMRATGEVATKQWRTRIDGRERVQHRLANGQEVDLDAKFIVGGTPMDHPGDPSAPASLVAACRCVMKFGLTPDSADLAQQGDTLAASAQEAPMSATQLVTFTVDSQGYSDAALVAAMTAMDLADTAAWEGVICVTGQPTGDRRMFNSLSWAELPLPLRRNIVESHGGIPQTQAVLVGRIDQIEMRQNEVWASGVIDLGSEAGRETARLMGTREAPGFLRGVSIDGDEEPGNPATIESVFPADCADLAMAEGAPSMEDMARCMEPELSIWSHARIRGATLTDIAALTQANLYLTDGATEMPDELEREATMPTQKAASGEPTMADVVESLTAAAATIVIPDLPPAWWYEQPETLPDIGAISITDEGRIFGLLAPGGVAHRGLPKRTEAPTRNVDYSKWANRPVRVTKEDGTVGRIAAGPITMACGHPSATGPLSRDAAVTMEMYENSCSIFATACIGEDRKGNVWIAGSVLPDVTSSQLARALACQLSGDWRPSRERQGWREFCAALIVPVPAFATAGSGARVSMQADALVASASPIRFASDISHECDCTEDVSGDTSNAARAIAASVGWDREARAREIYLSVQL